MRINVLADMHGELPVLPPCDLLILSGDITNGNQHGPRCGDEMKWRDWLFGEFADWLDRQEYWLAVGIGGNHDTVFEVWPELPKGIKYLQDSGCEFAGLKIWGHPWIPQFDGLAFNLGLEQRGMKIARIPADTDILVSHGPPHGISDSVDGMSVGCQALRWFIDENSPALVTCGHIHEGRGLYPVGKTMIINAARTAFSFDLHVPEASLCV